MRPVIFHNANYAMCKRSGAVPVFYVFPSHIVGLLDYRTCDPPQDVTGIMLDSPQWKIDVLESLEDVLRMLEACE